MSAVVEFINSFIEIIMSALKWVLDSCTEVLWGVLYIIFNGFLTLIHGIVSAIDVSTLVSTQIADWASLPGPMIWMINQIGIPQGMAIIVYAYGIRMLLNLIPANITRL